MKELPKRTQLVRLIPSPLQKKKIQAFLLKVGQLEDLEFESEAKLAIFVLSSLIIKLEL